MNDLESRYAEFSGGVAPTTSDHAAMRKFILKEMVKQAQAIKSGKLPVTKDWSWNRSFYPKYQAIESLRDRFVQCAEDHAGLRHTDEEQIMLFSLNGYFNWNDAASSANTHTTCGLFVRACRAAALVLEPKNPATRRGWATNTPEGTDPCIVGPGNKAGVLWAKRGSRVPRPGDIFHINQPGTNRDHVGIILRHLEFPNGEWHWHTVEGGQGAGTETRVYDKVLPLKNGVRMMGDRQLIKWIDFGTLADAATFDKWGATVGF